MRVNFSQVKLLVWEKNWSRLKNCSLFTVFFLFFFTNKVFYKLVAERTGDIQKLHNSVNFPTKDIDFSDFIDAETLFDDIKSWKNKI